MGEISSVFLKYNVHLSDCIIHQDSHTQEVSFLGRVELMAMRMCEGGGERRGRVASFG